MANLQINQLPDASPARAADELAIDNIGLVDTSKVTAQSIADLKTWANLSGKPSTFPPDQRTGTGFWHSTAGAVDAAAKLVDTADINADQVTYAKIQNVAANNRVLGRISGAGGDIEELTGTQATTLLDIFTDLLKGLVPASGGGTANFLRADGSWVAPGGSGTVTTTGTPANGNLTKFSGATSITNGDLTGDVTTSGGLATTIANNAVTTVKILDANVTKAKIENVAADKLLGRGNGGGAGAPQEITLGTNLSMSGTTLNASGGGGGNDPRLTTVCLGSNDAKTSTTATEVTGLQATAPGTGTFQFKYVVRYQSSSTSCGIKLAINHTGTVGWVVWSSWIAGTSGTGDQDNVGTPVNATSAAMRALATGTAPNVTLGVDTANADMLAIIEGLINVTADGDLELWAGIETATGSPTVTVMAGSALILTKVG